MLRKFTVLTMICMFAFSMLSNCYCAPAMTGTMHKMACHQQSSKAKGCCNPRIQNDAFENTAPQIHFEQKASSRALIDRNEPADLFALPENFNFASTPNTSPPPQFFLLQHSFLI